MNNLAKKINDIITNGNASTAVKRINELFVSESARANEISSRLEQYAGDIVDHPEYLTPNELVDICTDKTTYYLPISIVSAFAGAVISSMFMGCY